MNWTEKIEKAMRDLSNACKENDKWSDCYDCYKCPFARYCNCITMVCDSYPDDWFDDEEEE